MPAFPNYISDTNDKIVLYTAIDAFVNFPILKINLNKLN